MSRCEKLLLLSDLEANYGLTASVITPLKCRKRFLSNTLKTGPESKRDKGDDKHCTGRLSADEMTSQKKKEAKPYKT